MIIQILLFSIGALLFLFSFWRRLKDDYFENQIFTTGLYCMFFVIVFLCTSKYFLPSYEFWFALIGILVGLAVANFRYKMRFYECLEASVHALFLPVIVALFSHGIVKRQAESFFAAAGVIALVGLYYFLRLHYKKISWYKSGRIGFAGISVLSVFFIARAVLAISFPHMISLSSYDWVLSSIFAIISVLALLYLTNKPS